MALNFISPFPILSFQLKVFSDREHINVYYADEDLDQVIIKSHEELQEAFKVR